MLYYLIWMPIAASVYALYAWLILQDKAIPNSKWFWLAWIIGALPLWLVTSRWSKNIFFDGMLYDCVMIVSYALATAYFTGKLSSLGPVQWSGMVLIIVALWMIRYK